MNREYVEYIYREIARVLIGHRHVTDMDMMCIVGMGMEFRENKAREDMVRARDMAHTKSGGDKKMEEILLLGYVKRVLKIKRI